MAEKRVKPKSIFISSTFRDMQAERDVLRDIVLPKVNVFAEQYGSQVELIDLRWGVNTGGVSEEEQTARVLRTCLDEIQRSRPFFIGLLGERYGWIPPPPEIEAAGREAGFQTGRLDQSVTALEIEYGALRFAKSTVCRFYFRQMDLTGLSEEVKAVYRDSADTAEGKDKTARMAALKAAIHKEFPGDVKSYTARCEDGQVQGLEDFAAMAVQDITAALKQEWGEAPAEKPGAEAAEAAALDAFRQSRTAVFAGRERVVCQWRDYCLEAPDKTETEGKFVLLHGESGSGKSALLCKLMGEVEDRCLLLPFACGLTPRSSYVRGMLGALILRLEQFLGIPPLAAVPEPEQETDDAEDGGKKSEFSFEALRTRFWDLVGQAAKRTRVVMLIDALDQLVDEEAARELFWLKLPLPAQVRILCTVLDGPEIAAAKRMGGSVAELAPPRSDETAQIIGALAGKHHKQLADEVVAHILQKGCHIPLYLSLLVQDLVMMDRYEHAIIDSYTAGGLAPMEAINRFMKERIDQTPPHPQGALAVVVERAGNLVGQTFVRTVLGGIAASRRGLREQDLAGLCRQAGIPWDAAGFSWLRQLLGGQFVSGEQLAWDFSHQNTRRALSGDQAYAETANRPLTAYFIQNAKGDAFIYREILFHLYQLSAFDTAIGIIRQGYEEGFAGEMQEGMREILMDQRAKKVSTGHFPFALLEHAKKRSAAELRDVIRLTADVIAYSDLVSEEYQMAFCAASTGLLKNLPDKDEAIILLLRILRGVLRYHDSQRAAYQHRAAQLAAETTAEISETIDDLYALFQRSGEPRHLLMLGREMAGAIRLLSKRPDENRDMIRSYRDYLEDSLLPYFRDAADVDWSVMLTMHQAILHALEIETETTADDKRRRLEEMLHIAESAAKTVDAVTFDREAARILGKIAASYLEQGDDVQALRCAGEASDKYQAVFDRESSVENLRDLSVAQVNLGASLLANEQFDEALRYLEPAIRVLEDSYAQNPTATIVERLAEAYLYTSFSLFLLDKSGALVYSTWSYALSEAYYLKTKSKNHQTARDRALGEMNEGCFLAKETGISAIFNEVLAKHRAFAHSELHWDAIHLALYGFGSRMMYVERYDEAAALLQEAHHIVAKEEPNAVNYRPMTERMARIARVYLESADIGACHGVPYVKKTLLLLKTGLVKRFTEDYTFIAVTAYDFGKLAGEQRELQILCFQTALFALSCAIGQRESKQEPHEKEDKHLGDRLGSIFDFLKKRSGHPFGEAMAIFSEAMAELDEREKRLLSRWQLSDFVNARLAAAASYIAQGDARAACEALDNSAWGCQDQAQTEQAAGLFGALLKIFEAQGESDMTKKCLLWLSKLHGTGSRGIWGAMKDFFNTKEKR